LDDLIAESAALGPAAQDSADLISEMRRYGYTNGQTYAGLRVVNPFV
jgi:hypothetical protein